ncbi:MAG: tRNA (N(6)-L-threonylcarbamoyladenosine(37)-C(2))-methylthiotransferase MtaB [Muribaculaceae bacterium]|nr:tRNA (N(6)-L-threonylcarbamoyladenosine(37)-C(2))-methylthiotransferase MtaB [Muribaculaceae bacterium]
MTDRPHSENLKAAYYTLGCKLNFSETSTIGKMLRDRGVVRAQKGETPDICIVNTCSVTEIADKKGRSLIRRLHRLYPDASIIVTGCYAQLKPKEVAALEGVDIVLGSNEKLRIVQYIDRWSKTRQQIVTTTSSLDIREFIPSCERGDRTRFFLKVQDGCDYYCTYCTIPYARGRSRSGSIPALVEDARRAAGAGGKEIVITGVNIGDFGRDTGEKFLDLLKALDKVEGIERYRISSIEPNLLTPEILKWIATEAKAFMPHFHIPLQAGSDKVLKLMNRRYDTSLFEERIKMVRQMIPDAFIGVDIIAGARGESPEEWEKSLSFVKRLPITRLHVFPYSERPGTKALSLEGAVSNEEKHRRVALLTAHSDHTLREFMESNRGSIRKILWEHPLADTGMMTGLTDNYIRVVAPYDPSKINTITLARLDLIDPSRTETMLATHI